MSDSSIPITPGSGLNLDTRTEGTNSEHRQVIVIGDPSTNAGVAPVSATEGLSVKIANSTAPSVSIAGSYNPHGGAASGSPLSMGLTAYTDWPTVQDSGDNLRVGGDLVGRPIIMPYTIPEKLFNNHISSAITDTTATAIKSAGGAGIRFLVTTWTVLNTHGTVGTVVQLLDDSTLLWQTYVAALSDKTFSFLNPLRGTANKALNVKPLTTGSSILSSVAGFINPY